MSEIVVGIDTSDAAVAALGRAVDEAVRESLPLRAMHAWGTPLWAGASGLYALPLPSADRQRRVALEILQDSVAAAVETVPGGSTVELVLDVLQGDPGEHLRRLGNQARLVVVGRSHRAAVAEVLLGSTLAAILGRCSCPVMVVPANASRRPFARVVVGVDGSLAARAALRWAMAAAATHRCPLIAAHAWRAGVQGQQDRVAAANWLDQELRHVLSPEEAGTVGRRLPYGHPALALLVGSGPDDLLVLGTRGRSPVGSLLLGSVSRSCAARSGAPVVVVPPAAGS